jgi:type I restriction enzyme S subunit
LGDLTAKLVDGSHNPPKEADSGFPMLSARNIERGQIQFTKYRLIPEQDFKVEHGRTLVSPGDVLLTIVGTIGRTAIVPNGSQPFALQRSVAVLGPQGLTPEYLKLQLDSPNIQHRLESEAKGTAQKGIYLKALAEIRLRVAPLNEQRRIIAKFEELTERSRRAREALDAIPARLDRFRQSVLAAAFRGDLTAEWRAKNSDVEPASVPLERIRLERRRRWEEDLRARGRSPEKATYPAPINVETDGLFELPAGWCWANLDELSWGSGYGTSVKCDYEQEGAPVLRIPNIARGTIDQADLKFASENLDGSGVLAPGDFLIVRTNGSKDLIGRASVVTEPFSQPTYFASYLIRFRLLGGLGIQRYISLVWQSPRIRRTIESMAATSAGQYNVNLEKLKTITIPIPPVSEMEVLAELVENLLGYSESVSQTATSLGATASRLDQSILAKAFRGELVPQDPNDEPSSVLLDRIRNERAEAVVPKAKRGRKARELVEAKG